VPKRKVRLVPDAAGQFKALSAAERSRLKAAMQASIGDDDASVPNRNRFALRRISEQAEFEFRDGNLRVFYRIVGDEVQVDTIGWKTNNQLFIGDKKITL
jgi:mRNA-degrading endonuclease RelE of RelBE toxin-antitoxin system